MDSRRKFVGTLTAGLAGSLATGSNVLGANNRVRVGILGTGDRGSELANHLRACSNTEITALSDAYSKHLDRAASAHPAATAHADYRALLDDPNVDAEPEWSPDGEWIAFVSYREYPNSDVYIMRKDGSDVRRLTEDPAKDTYPVWTP